MKIAQNLDSLSGKIGSCKLVVVTKNRTLTEVKEVYDHGYRHFGENRVQALQERYEELPKDIEWHLIGHLQTNKVKYIAPFVSYIHSIDSIKLLMEVERQGAKCNRTIDCLLQLYIAREESKFGMELSELEALLQSAEYAGATHVRIRGLMGMATNTTNTDQIRAEFRNLKSIFDQTKRSYFATSEYFDTLSMGMSSDYTIAVEEGSTMLRIGSLIFE